MSHDVFISYSSKDKAVADAVVTALENNGFRCWFAPRDIEPGASWGESITEAISECKLMLLIFSGNSNQSKRVLEEVYFAISEEKTLIPFRIDNLDPTGAMRLHLSTLHWLDAYKPSWQVHLERLINTVSGGLGRSAPAPVAQEEPQTPVAREPQKERKKTPWLWIGIAVVITAILGMSSLLWFGERNTEKDAQSTALAALTQISDTPAATQTKTQTQTQTPTSTQTPRPSATATQTQTAVPSWVTEFAEPVLETIAGHSPNAETNFGFYPQWLSFACPEFQQTKINDGELIWSNCDMKWTMWYTDFVIEMDVDQLFDQDERWSFFFRAYSGYIFYSNRIGTINPNGSMRDQVDISLTDPYRLRIIVQGYETALYVNDQPILYDSLQTGFKNGEAEWFMGESDLSVSFDSMRIWDLNNLNPHSAP